MNRIKVNRTHLVKHFVQYRADAAGSGLQTRHRVVGDGETVLDRQRFFKRGKMAPDALLNARTLLLPFGGMKDEQPVNLAVSIQVCIFPCEGFLKSFYHLLSELCRKKLAALIRVFSGPV